MGDQRSYPSVGERIPVRVFEARTADAVWLAAARELLSASDSPLQASRAGPTRELLHVASVIEEPRERWILSREPALNPAFAIAEVVWILAGRNDSAFLNFWNPVLPRFAGSGPTYHGAYGHRLRENLGIDQIDRTYEALRHNPDTRQAVLQIWDGRKDLPTSEGAPNSEDIPCNICSFLKVRDGKLEWVQLMRSNDLVLGLPHNVVQFTSLQEIMAGWLGLEVGTYHHFSDSLHVYERTFEDLARSTEVHVPANPDRLDIPRGEFDEIFPDLEKRFEELRSDRLSEPRFRELLGSASMPDSYLNLLRIAAADSARRRGWSAAAEEAAGSCTNPVLHVAWERWAKRQRERSRTREREEEESTVRQL